MWAIFASALHKLRHAARRLRRALSLRPTAAIASIAGSKSRPSRLNAYSTDGGEVGFTVRSMTPFSSNSFSRVVSIFAETFGISRRNSEKRRAPALKFQIIAGVHVPPITDKHSDSGQSWGAGGLKFFRIFRAIRLYFLAGFLVTEWKLRSLLSQIYVVYKGNLQA